MFIVFGAMMSVVIQIVFTTVFYIKTSLQIIKKTTLHFPNEFCLSQT